MNFSNRAESDANRKHDRDSARRHRLAQELRRGADEQDPRADAQQQLADDLHAASKVVHDQTITILAPSQDDHMDDEDEDEDGGQRNHEGVDRQAQGVDEEEEEDNHSGPSLSMAANRLLLDEQSSSM